MQVCPEIVVTLSDELLDVLQAQARVLARSTAMDGRQPDMRHHRDGRRAAIDPNRITGAIGRMMVPRCISRLSLRLAFVRTFLQWLL